MDNNPAEKKSTVKKEKEKMGSDFVLDETKPNKLVASGKKKKCH